MAHLALIAGHSVSMMEKYSVSRITPAVREVMGLSARAQGRASEMVLNYSEIGAVPGARNLTRRLNVGNRNPAADQPFGPLYYLLQGHT